MPRELIRNTRSYNWNISVGLAFYQRLLNNALSTQVLSYITCFHQCVKIYLPIHQTSFKMKRSSLQLKTQCCKWKQSSTLLFTGCSSEQGNFKQYVNDNVSDLKCIPSARTGLVCVQQSNFFINISVYVPTSDSKKRKKWRAETVKISMETIYHSRAIRNTNNSTHIASALQCMS